MINSSYNKNVKNIFVKKNILITASAFLFFAVVFFTACKKDNYVNPYDDPSLKPPTQNPDLGSLSPGNFAYLHYKIFKPTCANSGCHDGTFPPDFRTISSTYNTLVYQPPIKSILSASQTNPYKYRVWPSNADSSVLYKRLIFTDILAEQMPLSASGDPFPYWTGHEAEYTQAVKSWINAGALDMFGNAPSLGNKQPQVTGLLGFNSGSISGSFNRAGTQYPPLEVPAGVNIDIWFLISDDATPNSALSYNKVKVSRHMYDTTGAQTLPLNYYTGSNPATGPDFSGAGSTFTHYVTINTTGYTSGTIIYLRVYVDDNSQGAPTEIPNAGSDAIMMGYFALKVQ